MLWCSITPGGSFLYSFPSSPLLSFPVHPLLLPHPFFFFSSTPCLGEQVRINHWGHFTHKSSFLPSVEHYHFLLYLCSYVYIPNWFERQSLEVSSHNLTIFFPQVSRTVHETLIGLSSCGTLIFSH